ncbi:MAG TPA: hypothetical protein VH598_01420, partial [Verrucomicrobiae bacterium]|nr:hypothetical protein [Verrucomicrobiae bacterium]
PDFSRISISRLTAEGRTNLVDVDLSAALKGDCAKDVPLQWGDVVEIPAYDHNVNANWNGLPPEMKLSLCRCLARGVSVIVKGEKHEVLLSPGFLSQDEFLAALGVHDSSHVVVQNFWVRTTLNGANLIRASSDLKRVKVRRADLATKKTQEFLLNEEAGNSNDLWLRDGDVIEVPDKGGAE